MLDLTEEIRKLAPCFTIDGVYRRGGSPTSWGIGDSFTDVGALGLILPKYCCRHVAACQLPSGRMLRHPDRIVEYNKDLIAGSPEQEKYDFSRDHILAMSFAALWSRNPELRQVCRRFFWYIVRHGGRFCPGTVGQGVVNPGVLAALLMACGGLFWFLGALLYLVYIPWLHVSVNYAEKGYVRILHAEHAIIAWRFGGIPLFAVQRIFNKCYEQEPQNLFYEFWANRGLSKLSSLRLRTMWANWTPAGGKRGWAWTQADGRPGTGIDLLYLMRLAGKI